MAPDAVLVPARVPLDVSAPSLQKETWTPLLFPAPTSTTSPPALNKKMVRLPLKLGSISVKEPTRPSRASDDLKCMMPAGSRRLEAL